MSLIRKKIILVGDGGCGKTSAIFAYESGEKPSSYIPTVFEQSSVNTEINKKKFEEHLPDKPFMIVALKCDLRDGNADSSQKMVSFQSGRKMADDLGAAKYCECSGISDVFESAAKAEKGSTVKCPKCHIL